MQLLPKHNFGVDAGSIDISITYRITQQPLKSCEGNPSYGFDCSLRSLVWRLTWFGGFWDSLS